MCYPLKIKTIIIIIIIIIKMSLKILKNIDIATVHRLYC